TSVIPVFLHLSARPDILRLRSETFKWRYGVVQREGATVRAICVILVCCGVGMVGSCRHIADPDDLNRLQEVEQAGLLTFLVDSIEFRTDNAFAEQTSGIPDARVYLRLEESGRSAYFDAQMRVIRSNSSVLLMNLYIRFGDIDSSAEFYQMRPPTAGFFSSLSINSNDVIEGSFMGQLEGTGTRALGKTLTIRNGMIRVALKSGTG
ncbi:MAG: hypothetical protein OEM41_11070, partial [Ignavibacteria bacterium]|nr:hypothetical protein [Ignavibacteria bacterium]